MPGNRLLVDKAVSVRALTVADYEGDTPHFLAMLAGHEQVRAILMLALNLIMNIGSSSRRHPQMHSNALSNPRRLSLALQHTQIHSDTQMSTDS